MTIVYVNGFAPRHRRCVVWWYAGYLCGTWVSRLVGGFAALSGRGTEQQVDIAAGAFGRPVTPAPLDVLVRRRLSDSPSVVTRHNKEVRFFSKRNCISLLAEIVELRKLEKLLNVFHVKFALWIRSSVNRHVDAVPRIWDPGDVKVIQGLLRSIQVKYKFDRFTFWRRPLNESMPAQVKKKLPR